MKAAVDAAARQSKRTGKPPAITTRDADAAADFSRMCDALGLPPHVREHLGVPGRCFRSDLAWLREKVAVEIHGGQWTGGRHVRGKGFEADIEKANLLQLEGWVTLSFTASAAKSRTVTCVEMIRRALELRSTA